MKRTDFIKGIIGTSILWSTDTFSYLMGAISNQQQTMLPTTDFATFGVVHLNNTSLEKAIAFWTNIAGMKLRRTPTIRRNWAPNNKRWWSFTNRPNNLF